MNSRMKNIKVPRLGVNIDHVATLRQARGEIYPSLVDAAKVAFECGADQITIHLREDRRHIQDTDVEAVSLVTKRFGLPLNLEIGCNPEIIEIAIATAPDWICLVPENRIEQTTEGGLNLVDDTHFNKIKAACEQLRNHIPGVKISLFVESKREILERCVQLSVDAVEIHTGDYARAFLNNEETESFLVEFREGYDFCQKSELAYHAGHGLTDESVLPLVELGVFAEYNIGHWIVAQSVFEGLGNVVKRIKGSLTKPVGE